MAEIILNEPQLVVSTLTITGTSRSLRRWLGPTAWAVLEDVALDAVVEADGALVAATSVRTVAAHLGVQPGTAAKALRRLRDAGLLSHLRTPGAGGRFGRSSYRLSPAVGICISPPHMEHSSAAPQHLIDTGPPAERRQLAAKTGTPSAEQGTLW